MRRKIQRELNIALHLDIIRRDLERLAIACHRIIDPPQVFQGIAQIKMRVG